jgi:hypothetical protein
MLYVNVCVAVSVIKASITLSNFEEKLLIHCEVLFPLDERLRALVGRYLV